MAIMGRSVYRSGVRCVSVAYQLLARSRMVFHAEPDGLTEIYQPEVSLCVWDRELCVEIHKAAQDFVRAQPNANARWWVSANNFFPMWQTVYGRPVCALARDIQQLVDMFCCLFDGEHVGLRLSVLRHAMCPKFHIDRVPVRLICSYLGPGTQWLPDEFAVGNAQAIRGAAKSLLTNNGVTSHTCKSLRPQSVGLMKGATWDDAQYKGLMHRSPPIVPSVNRLLLSLDVV